MLDKAIHTQLCEDLGIKYPIMLAGMGSVAMPPLVAAVSNAGGLGVLGMSGRSPWFIEKCINEVKERAPGKPFGVDLTIPSVVVQQAVSEEEIYRQIPRSHLDFVANLMKEWGVPDPKEPPQDPRIFPPY